MILFIILGVLIALLMANFVTMLLRRDSAEDSLIVHAFRLIWEKLYPNAMVFGTMMFLIAMTLINHVAEDIVPEEAFWLAIGVLLNTFSSAVKDLVAPPPGPDPWPQLVAKFIDKFPDWKERT